MRDAKGKSRGREKQGVGIWPKIPVKLPETGKSALTGRKCIPGNKSLFIGMGLSIIYNLSAGFQKGQIEDKMIKNKSWGEEKEKAPL